MQTTRKKLCFLVNGKKARGNTLVCVRAMQTMLGQVSTVAPFRFQTPVVCTIKCAKTAKSVSFGTEKNVKLKDSEYKNSSLLGQIDHKNTKEKSKLLLKCFVNLFTEIPPISAINVPKLPGMSLVEPRKKSKKRIAISKLALQ